MIQEGTNLAVADNSGARRVACIRVLKSARYASVGDVIIVSVKEAVPKGRVKKGEVHKALVVRVAFGIRRDDGSRLTLDTNAVVLLNDKHDPLGTRIFGPVPRELREGHMKIVSLAPEVV